MNKLLQYMFMHKKTFGAIALQLFLLICSAGIGVVLEKLISDPLPAGVAHGDAYYLRIFIIVIACFTGIALVFSGTVLGAFLELQRQRNFNVTIHRDYYSTKGSSKSAYNLCSTTALRATKSIIVIGPHFIHGGEGEATVGTESHADYLTNGISNAVKRHADSHEGDFLYKRIVQFDQDVAEAVNEQGVLRQVHIGDRALSVHIDEMLKLNATTHSVDVKIYGRKFVPSFPSTLIIDDQWIFFSLPSKIDAPGCAKSHKLAYDFVLAVEDRTGTVPKQFRKMISQFEVEGKEIKSVVLDQIDTHAAKESVRK